MMELFNDSHFWVAVAFVLFVVLTAKPIGKAIAKALDARADRIRAQLEEAEKLRAEAEALLAENRRKQQDALREAQAIVANATNEAGRIHRETLAHLEDSLARREKMALDKIAQAEAEALAEVRREAVDVAIAAAARLLSETVDERRNEALVDTAIAEIDKRLH
jgi:F-type H+-transporting ATPase subunit b